MKRVNRSSWEETSRFSRRVEMRNRFPLIMVVAVLSTSPKIFAQTFDPHDLGGIWSRNSQGYGGGGTCRGCGDRGTFRRPRNLASCGSKFRRDHEDQKSERRSSATWTTQRQP